MMILHFTSLLRSAVKEVTYSGIMQKLVDVFDSITEFSHLYRSFFAASKGKRYRLTIAKYKFNLEQNLFRLQQELRNGSYQFGPYKGFWVEEPKRRFIESAVFENRIVHHAIHSRLETWLEPVFYEHSYACRTGRGTHSAMFTLKGWVKDRRLKYYLKCDVKKFFPSIDRDILIKILHKKIGDERLLRLLEELIHSAPGKRGIPIGNLTSQLLANFYMNELDQFIKRKLRIKRYIRYMDDFVLLFNDEEAMRDSREEIEKFTSEVLRIELSPHKTRMDKIKNGISFVGYKIKNGKVRVRNKPLKSMKRKVLIALHESKLRPPLDLTSKEVKRSKFFASYSSYLGQTVKTSYGSILNKMILKEIGND